jgi:hypothetical protein
MSGSSIWGGPDRCRQYRHFCRKPLTVDVVSCGLTIYLVLQSMLWFPFLWSSYRMTPLCFILMPLVVWCKLGYWLSSYLTLYDPFSTPHPNLYHSITQILSSLPISQLIELSHITVACLYRVAGSRLCGGTGSMSTVLTDGVMLWQHDLTWQWSQTLRRPAWRRQEVW